MRFGEILKTQEAEGKEKHVPVMEIKKSADSGENEVMITVGKEVPHPNTVEHHIKWIQLHGIKQNGQTAHLGTFDLGPVYASPKVITHVKLNEFKRLFALEYCNIHGIWENSIEV
ncbi:MAG: class II SORL domain-containing protein [Candidatus Zixiibacteriota bacterium]